jgi:hypothetical protein
MVIERTQLYGSPGDDSWYLAREPESGMVFIQHQASSRSGGKITDFEVSEFLNDVPPGPQQQEFIRLLNSLFPNVSLLPL